jgi:peptidoglycan/xylan/chitin deacetylase (PgdA/CDA1 family)
VDDNARRCALPGCNEVIEDIPGRPPRRYCTAAHRAAARQARRAAAQAGQDARLAAALPWLLEPQDEPEAPRVPHGVREQRALVEARRVERAAETAATRAERGW